MIAQDVANRLRKTAAARDRRGGTATAEREIIRDSGLLRATIPVAYGGWGLTLPDFLKLQRVVLAADGALGHLLGFHALALANAAFVGSQAQSEWIWRETAKHNWWWGNAHNTPALDPTDPGHVPAPTAVITQTDEGDWRLCGTNRYCSGSVGADMLIFAVMRAGDTRLRTGLVSGIVPARRAGVAVREDWDAFGQRQTDSGSVAFTDVVIREEELFLAPGIYASAFSSMRATLVHLFLANTYQGISAGALHTALDIGRARDVPLAGAGVATFAEDPFVLRRIGDLWTQLTAAEALVDQAAAQFAAALEDAHDLTTAARAQIDIAVYSAKVAAAQVGLRVSSEMFELLGARATTETLALDRFWRNLRVHTLHDPLDARLRDIGKFVLTGEGPAIAPPG